MVWKRSVGAFWFAVAIGTMAGMEGVLRGYKV